MRLLSLLVACGTEERAAPASEPVDSATGGAGAPRDTHEEDGGTAGCDSGIAAWWWGSFEADGSAYVSARAGLRWWDYCEQDWVCRIDGDLRFEEDLSASGCPDCTWAWDLSGLTETLAEGWYCDFASPGPSELDGQLDYSWAFAETYVYVYDGTPLTFEDNVLARVPGYDWVVVAFNLPAYGIYQTVGDASYVTFYRSPAAGVPSYYHYYPEAR
ncbi:MAG: hypothetical protein ACOZNI_26505 [Myxococcota bacterium]